MLSNPIYLSIYLFVCLLSVCLSNYRSSLKSVCLPAAILRDCLSVFLNLTTSKTKQFCETSSIFELDNVKNETILRDFLNFEVDNIKNETMSARLPQFSKLTTSKTKQFSETSFKNGKLSAELTASYQCVLRFVQLHLSKVLRLPRKSDARSYEVLHLSRKIISANLKI